MFHKKILFVLVFCYVVLGFSQLIVAEAQHEKPMSFSIEGAWMTAPDMLHEFNEQDLFSTRTIPFTKLAEGVGASSKYVKKGKYSWKWDNHPRYPTIHCPNVPKDWSSSSFLTFWIYSEESTGERITLAVMSDSDKTPWKDYFMDTFRVDWIGWRKFSIPFSDFFFYEEPAGWNKIDSVYFFTKIFNQQPNPHTALYIDDMKLESKEVSLTKMVKQDFSPKQSVTYQKKVYEIDLNMLNHKYPEIRSNRPSIGPIVYEPYFKAERALNEYYPRFQPGFVSLSPFGQAYIQYKSYIVETLDKNGKWIYQNLLKNVIEPYARENLRFTTIGIDSSGQTNDTSIRFDKDGDAYMLSFIWDLTKNRHSRRGLLLHSRDGLKTWQVYVLPYYMARFEKFVGHNRDRLKRPPVILLSRGHAPTSLYITIPEKQSDGTLLIPKPQHIVDNAIPFLPHSGEANNAVTHGDKVFIVYGRLGVLPRHTVQDGTPTYVITYDIRAKTITKPILIGFGGVDANDSHNWPSLAIDSKGILHVIINGHHNHFTYVRSHQAYNILKWTQPERIAEGTSYAGLICDKNDTLYTVARNSYPGYLFRLSFYRKKVGQPWEKAKHLVVPFKPYYKVWYHKLVMDPVTERLFLSYYAQSPRVSLFKDEYMAYIYTWPDREKNMLKSKQYYEVPLGTDRDRTSPRDYRLYSVSESEIATIVSDNGGDTWHLAETKDFSAKEVRH